MHVCVHIYYVYPSIQDHLLRIKEQKQSRHEDQPEISDSSPVTDKKETSIYGRVQFAKLILQIILKKGKILKMKQHSNGEFSELATT